MHNCLFFLLSYAADWQDVKKANEFGYRNCCQETSESESNPSCVLTALTSSTPLLSFVTLPSGRCSSFAKYDLIAALLESERHQQRCHSGETGGRSAHGNKATNEMWQLQVHAAAADGAKMQRVLCTTSFTILLPSSGRNDYRRGSSSDLFQ